MAIRHDEVGATIERIFGHCMPIPFRFRWIPLCATLIVVVAGIVLGQWQTRRAEEKLQLGQRLETRAKEAPLTALPADGALAANEFRHVRLRGEFLPGWTIYLENRPLEGATGFYVLTPFKIADAPAVVMVARGWAPRNPADRTRVPAPAAPTGMSTIEGVLRGDAGRVMQLGQADAPYPGAILQNLDIAALSEASGLPLSAFVLEQLGGAADGLVRRWPSPALGIERHRGYAVQWYALAAMAVLFFLVTGYRRARHDPS